MQPEQIAQALDGMSKTSEGKKQLQQLMMQFQQEMQGGSQAFRQGGKIHDFICKHAKGGAIKGCGCKQEGGSFSEPPLKKYEDNYNTILQNNQSFDPRKPIKYSDVKAGLIYTPYSQELPPAEVPALRSKYNRFPNKRLYSINPKIMNNMAYGPEERLAGMEKGGKVETAEKGYKVRNGSYSAEVNAPGDTTRRKVYPSTTQIMQTYPNGAVRYSTIDNRSDFQTNRWDVTNGRPTLLQRIFYGNKRYTPFDKNNWNEIISNHPEDPRNVLKKCGGKVKKNK